MDRRNMLLGAALLPPALAATPAAASTGSLRDKLLGSWKLIEPATVDRATGTRGLWVGRPGPYVGMIAYMRNGTMSVHIGSARPAASKVWDQLSERERAAAADSWYGYFGHFDVDEARQQVRHMIIAALMPDETGITYVRNVRLIGNRVTLTTVMAPTDKTYNELTWERI